MARPLKTGALAAVLVLAAVPRAEAQCLVLDAVPFVRVDADPDSTSRSTRGLEPQRVTIIKTGEDYLWATRENRRLIRFRSGAYDYFIEPMGGGMVKVDWISAGIPDPVEPDGSPFFEHVSLGMATITYWGVSPVYEPGCTP